MTRLPTITLVLAAALTAAGGMTTAAAEPRRPNILYIITDDQSPFDFSFYNPASTLDAPVIERLAAEGMIFDAAYQMGSFSGAVCTPSRHMVMCGRTVWHLPIGPAGQSHCPPGLASSTLAAVFNAAGYDTMRTCKKGNSYAAANRQFTVLHEAVKRGGTHETGSGWHGDQVMNFLAEREQTADTDPFLIYLGFSHPHDTRDGTPELLEKYGASNHTDEATRPPAKPGQPPLPANWLPKHPFDNGHMNVRDEMAVSGVWGNRDEQTIRNEQGREYACSENIDRQIGRVLDKLAEMGELENTWIFYTSDHGIAIGRHGLQGKQNLYEHTWRVPFVVKGPGVKAGSRVPGNIYLGDTLATLCEIAGIEPPETNEGTSFLPVLEGREATIRDTLYGVYCGGQKPGIRSVRRGDWKLIKYESPSGGLHTQLFNLAENPHEFLAAHHAPEVAGRLPAPPTARQRNLADDPAHRQERAEMEALLLAEMQRHDDPFLFSDQRQAPEQRQTSDRRTERPNIVLVIADDQGYGDLGHTGNPVIQTPHLDALAAESTSLTDYHVAPTCSPTRAALLTGHWTDRTGVWHTINGRSMLRENEVTLGRLLADNGYATGMFGKWHLGDNFPYRPEDRGFAEVYRHGGGGVGQTPDCWDNAYFDGHYFHNGEVVPAEGFCTDVFFRQAHRFIRREAEAGRPFFAYISTNAPHGPLHCPQEYLDRYPDQPAAIAAFFGMITNIDDNVGATRKLLADLGIAKNTLFIFTTDNGTATGAKVFNAGMRGTKGSEYDGGHRVPFIAHWPAAGWNRQHACDRLCHAVDVVPTLVELAGGKRPEGLAWDGVSIRNLLDPAADTAGWPDRMLVTDSQRVRDPIKWKQTAVMSQRWRLVNGKELYDIGADPGQRHNVAAAHPEQVAAMTAFYDAWWAELQPTFAQTTEIYLGHPEAAEVVLTCHDWIGPGECPWNQSRVRAAAGYPRPAAADEKQPAKQRPRNKQPDKQQPATGRAARHEAHWAVKVVTAGDYTVAVRRWPAEANRGIVAGLPPGLPVPGASRAFRETAGVALPVVSACLRIDGHDLETVAVEPDATVARFTVPLAAGSHELAPVFRTADGHEVGGYYCTVSGPLEP